MLMDTSPRVEAIALSSSAPKVTLIAAARTANKSNIHVEKAKHGEP